MDITINVPDYDKHHGLTSSWVDGFEIEVTVGEHGQVIIFANKAGLATLAAHFLTLSQDVVPPSHHFHLSSDNVLESGSTDLILGKLANATE